MDLRRYLIGVVDDDSRVLESIGELLASGGYDVLPFSSAEAFIDADGFQRVDCVISDIGMPATTGWDLLKIARTSHPNLPVILITARDEEHTRAAGEAKGAWYLFRKPFDGKELLNTLETIFKAKKNDAV